MGARLLKNEDPSDNMDRMRRMQLVRFAHDNGQMDIHADMPASLIRDYLRKRGITRAPPQPSIFGAMNQHPDPGQNVPAVDATSDLERQYLAQQPERRRPGRPKSEINVLRDECKRLGIRMDRRDRMPDLKAKIAQYAQQNIVAGR